MSTKYQNTSLYLHVDDIPTLAKARSQKELSSKAFEWAQDFKQCTDDLKLDISDNSVAVPICQSVENFTKRAVAARIPCTWKNKE